jgi:hypothetical protein
MANVKQKAKSEQGNQVVKRAQTILKYTTEMKSDFMSAYVGKNIGSLITLYGRIGGLLRLVQDNVQLSEMVEDWVSYNEKLAQHQLDEAEAVFEQIEMQSVNKVEVQVEIERPEPLVSEWKVNHTSFTNLIRLMIKLDTFLVRSEEAYFKGLMTDVQMSSLNRQVGMVIDSYLERIMKATSPGKNRTSKEYKYSNQELLKHIRDAGYRLEFHSLPKELQELVETYNERYSKYKSLAAERMASERAKAAARKKQDVAKEDVSEAV